MGERTTRFPVSPGTTEDRYAAALMTSAQVHPRSFMRRELTRVPITFRSLVSKTTTTTKEGRANRSGS